MTHHPIPERDGTRVFQIDPDLIDTAYTPRSRRVA